MRIIEQYTKGKSTTTPSEDAVVVNAYYAGVIDGATPKTPFCFAGNETPGLRAARVIADAILQLPPHIEAQTAIQQISSRLRESTDFEHLPARNRPMASLVLYSATRREVWMVGDCQFLLPAEHIAVKGYKQIDRLLSEWRRDVNNSLLCRGVMTIEQLLAYDPGRKIIQPHITRQVQYQNRADGHPLAYAMLDGTTIPETFIQIHTLPATCRQLAMGSDGYPELFSSLSLTEQHLARLLQADPLCIGPLLGTKGQKPGNCSYDDRTYLNIEI